MRAFTCLLFVLAVPIVAWGTDAEWVTETSVSDASLVDAHLVDAHMVAGDLTEVTVTDACPGCHRCQNGTQAKCPCHGVDTDPGFPRKPRCTKPGDRDRGDCPPLRYRMDDCKRSGHSQCTAPWAICGRPQTRFGRYTAWFVGGGAAFADVPGLSDIGCKDDLIDRGRGRYANGCGQDGEGTWGLDYEGFAGHAKVWLKYTRGRKQGGEGAYETDGEPKVIAKLKDVLLH